MAFKFFSMMPPYAQAAGVASDGPIWWRPKYYGVVTPPLPPPIPAASKAENHRDMDRQETP